MTASMTIPEDEQDRWLPVAQAARQVGAPVRSLYNWLASGKLSGRPDSGGRVLVPIGGALALAQARHGKAEGLPMHRAAGALAGGTAAFGMAEDVGDETAELARPFEPQSRPWQTAGAYAASSTTASPSRAPRTARTAAAPPASDVDAARADVELLRLRAERERVARELEAERARREQEARRAAEEAVAVDHERQLRHAELEATVERRQLELARERDAVESERRVRHAEETERDAAARHARENAARRERLEQAAVRLANAEGGTEAIGAALRAAREVLDHYGPTADGELVGVAVEAAVRDAVTPWRAAREERTLVEARRELLHAALRRVAPWLLLAGASPRPLYASPASDERLRSVAREAAALAAANLPADARRVADAVAAEVARLQAEHAAEEAERAWAAVRARLDAIVATTFGHLATPEERARARQTLERALDARPPHLRPETFAYEAARVLEPLRQEFAVSARWRENERNLADLVRSRLPAGATPADRERAVGLAERALASERTQGAHPDDFGLALKAVLAPVKTAIVDRESWAQRRREAAQLARDVLGYQATADELERAKAALEALIDARPAGLTVASLPDRARVALADIVLEIDRRAAVDFVLMFADPRLGPRERLRRVAEKALAQAPSGSRESLRAVAQAAIEREVNVGRR